MPSADTRFDRLAVTTSIVQAERSQVPNVRQTSAEIRDLTGSGGKASVVETVSLQSLANFSIVPGRQTSFSSTSYQFKDDGTYLIELRAIDSDGGASVKTGRIAVANVAPTTDIAGAPTPPSWQDRRSVSRPQALVRY